MPTLTTTYGLYKPLVNNPVDQDLWGGFLNTNMDSIDTLLPQPGMVFPFAGSSVPSAYLLCYGQAVSRTTYSRLFGVISTTYGPGNGTTTFNLPDYRGRVLAGKDDMGGSAAGRLTTAGSGVDGLTLGAVGGAQNVALTEAQGPIHAHDLQTNGGIQIEMRFSNDSGFVAGSGFAVALADATPTPTRQSGSGAAHNNTQPSIIQNYIIKW
jgi:microcystin-dependent protein